MVIASFQVQDKLKRARFFQETLLVADIKIDIVFEILFLTFSNANIQFAEGNLTWKTYTAVEALFTTKKIQIINQKEFVKVALDPNQKAFIVHIAAFTLKMTIYPSRQAQIASLKIIKIVVIVPAEYSDFTNVFSDKLAAILQEHIEINTHPINLEESKQLPYELIYSLKPVELKILKTYIKTNLANDFIRFSKFATSVLILFDQKPDGNL